MFTEAKAYMLLGELAVVASCKPGHRGAWLWASSGEAGRDWRFPVFAHATQGERQSQVLGYCWAQ